MPGYGDSVPRPAAPAAMAPLSGELRLCGVLSSHVGDEKRLRRLRQCLESVVWSSPESLVAEEHISKEPDNTWLLFSDDDDLWGPERLRLYGIIIDQHGRVPGVTAVCATHKVRPKDPKKVAMTPKEVQQQLKGDAMHCGGVHQEEESMAKGVWGHFWLGCKPQSLAESQEFFDFACPASSLGVFLEMCNDKTLLHPFCDLRFSRFLQEYYQGGKALCKQLGGQPGSAKLQEMTDFVAALRQNIEAILIRHFPESPMKTGEMKRIAVGQAQGQVFALKLAEKLAREACSTFGVRLE
eukprot:s685_g7.t1